MVDPAVASAQDAPNVSIGLGTTFAVADFDGDPRLDLATIEVVQNNSSTTNYRVLVQLSLYDQVSTQVAAPRGGFVIRAVNVNTGNHFIDLVVSAALSGQPVAILINDGSGSFSRVPPSTFPEAVIDTCAESATASESTTAEVGVTLQRRPAMHRKSSSVAEVPLHIDSAPLHHSIFFVAALTTKAERAPPLEIRCS
jgi:hypothetical protein